MRKFVVFCIALLLSFMCFGYGIAQKCNCDTIKEGTVWYSTGHYLEGEPLTTGYDIFGYTYQAHQFRGSYFNAYSGGVGGR